MMILVSVPEKHVAITHVHVKFSEMTPHSHVVVVGNLLHAAKLSCKPLVYARTFCLLRYCVLVYATRL